MLSFDWISSLLSNSQIGKAKAARVSACSRYLLADLDAKIVILDLFKCSSATALGDELSAWKSNNSKYDLIIHQVISFIFMDTVD